MRILPVLFSPILLSLAALPLAACQTLDRETGACPIAPAAQAEERPKPPVSEQEQIWQPGHWDWNGTSYAWRPGIWMQRTGGTLWMDGHWTRDQVPAPCYWVPPHWVN